MKKEEELMSQITSANHLACNITEQDIKDMFKSIYFNPLIQPKDPITGKFIKGPKVSKYNSNLTILCGTDFMNKFDEAMKEESNKFEWKIMNKDSNSI